MKEKMRRAAAPYTAEEKQECQTQLVENEKKVVTSFYVLPSVYDDIKRLAGYRRVSAGSLINEILSDYVEASRYELAAYDAFSAQMEAMKK